MNLRYNHCSEKSQSYNKVDEMNKFKTIAAATIMLTVVGCATKAPTTGDFMRMHAAEEKAMGKDQKNLGKEWDHGSELKQSGKKLVKDGEELVKNGENKITKGKQNIEQGNKDILEGTKIMQESEREFKEKYPDLELNLNK